MVAPKVNNAPPTIQLRVLDTGLLLICSIRNEITRDSTSLFLLLYFFNNRPLFIVKNQFDPLKMKMRSND